MTAISARSGRILALLLAIPVIGRGQAAAASAETIRLDATLIARSDRPTLKQIAPYREALVVDRFRVDKVHEGTLKAGEVLVARWAFYDGRPQATLEQDTGTRLTGMTLVPFEDAPAEIRQATIRNNWAGELRRRLYADVGQPVRLGNHAAERWDYNCALSEKMPLYLRGAGGIRLVAVGDSRTAAGVDPRHFVESADRRAPQAYNLAIGRAGLSTVQLQIETHILPLPNLEWVVYGISPRVFNAHWEDVVAGPLGKSSGLRYDRRHQRAIWRFASPHPANENGSRLLPVAAAAAGEGEAAAAVDGDRRTAWAAQGDGQWLRLDLGKPVTVTSIEIDFTKGAQRQSTFDVLMSVDGKSWRRVATGLVSRGPRSPWGYHGSRKRAKGEPDKARPHPRMQRRHYQFSQERFAVLEAMVRSLKGRGARMLAFTPPWSPATARNPNTDDDGTSPEDYDHVVRLLRNLHRRYPGTFFFVDINQKAEGHGFAAADFTDTDHLNVWGAAKLTRRLDAFIAEQSGRDARRRKPATAKPPCEAPKDPGFERFRIPPTRARYVRLVGRGNNAPKSSEWNSYSEVRIYGSPSTAESGR
jgi:hypothetical protein